MEKLSMCRICLAGDLRMQIVINTHLQEIYQSLSLMPFLTQDNRPMQACYICCAKLQNCYELRKTILRSEQLFSQMLSSYVVSANTFVPPELGGIFHKNRLSITAVVDLSIGHEQQKKEYDVKVMAPVGLKAVKTEETEVYDDAEGRMQSDGIPLHIIKREIDDTTTTEQTRPPACGQSSLVYMEEDISFELEKTEVKSEVCDANSEPSAAKSNGVAEDDDFSETESLEENDLEPESQDSEIPSTPHHGSRRNHDPDSSFQWSSERQTYDVPGFNDSQSGIHLEQSDVVVECDVFQHFVDNDYVTMIANMTNKYHSYFVSNMDLRTQSRLHAWYDVTVSELHIFFAIMMLMTRNRHLTIEEHWSSDVLLNSPIFSKLMPRNRFAMILSMLYFSELTEENAVLSKIQKCVNHTRQKFNDVITPFKNICLDESLVKFKGRLAVKHNLSNKISKLGVKLFVLRDVETGIIIDFIIYCGSDTDVTDPCGLGVGGSVVATLVKPFAESNRHLYVDNWYSSPQLFKYLHENDIFACGTVKRNRKGMPKLNSILKVNGIEVQYSGQLMALKFKDEKYIYMLSTIHDNSMETSKTIRCTGLPEIKPKIYADYTKNMASLDNADLLLSSLKCVRKTIKWHKKLFFHIFDMQMLNAYFCFKHLKNLPNLKFAEFQLRVVHQLIERYHSGSVLGPISTARGSNNPLRLLPRIAKDHMPTSMGKYQRCRQCAINKQRKSTRFTCKVCNVYLCAAPCFEKYHEV